MTDKYFVDTNIVVYTHSQDTVKANIAIDILAKALLADCSILYSEDMQHGLKIDNKLTIIYPFL